MCCCCVFVYLQGLRGTPSASSEQHTIPQEVIWIKIMPSIKATSRSIPLETGVTTNNINNDEKRATLPIQLNKPGPLA